MLIFFWTLQGSATVTTTVPNPTILGGGQEDVERAKADKRRRVAELEAKREQLKERLAKAEEEKRRKAKAKAESKARKAIELRIERFTRELMQAEAEIMALTMALAELQAVMVDTMMDRRRRLLLLSLVM